ncbi:hypothetical protein H0H81_011493 [Sphagnurus paluster]|uniref:Uncharacterized protein n=1 Tax=Sphagnurus paluster TaxID=117069 RepID=A0A9P7FUY7_9AGAR|nr:hypothetical protein H0H81_011493 [Sphagnurus paluster]
MKSPLSVTIRTKQGSEVVHAIKKIYVENPSAILQRQKDGWTPLHLALAVLNPHAVEALLDIADPAMIQDSQNPIGATPLDVLKGTLNTQGCVDNSSADAYMRKTIVFLQRTLRPTKFVSRKAGTALSPEKLASIDATDEVSSACDHYFNSAEGTYSSSPCELQVRLANHAEYRALPQCQNDREFGLVRKMMGLEPRKPRGRVKKKTSRASGGAR